MSCYASSALGSGGAGRLREKCLSADFGMPAAAAQQEKAETSSMNFCQSALQV
jgi:hypothetical protein